MKTILLILATLTLLTGPARAQSEDPGAIIDALHQAAREADGETYFGLFTPDARFIGTDATERWTVAEFEAYATPYFIRGQGWDYQVVSRELSILPIECRCVAVFDEVLENASYGTVRGSGVLRLTDEGWKIEQYVLSFAVPNDVARDVVAVIRAGGSSPTLMEFEDDAFVLSARPHGDTGVVADLLTEHHGRRLTYVAGGASRRMKPFLQPGSRVRAAFRSRDDSQLGSARLEPRGEDISQLFDSPLALAGLAAATAVVQGALPEREPEPAIFAAMEALMSAFAHDAVWPAVFIRFELGLLASLGFGLNLDVCAVSGSTDDLAWVSPRTGRAVSRTEGAAYADRLLGLPPFLLGNQAAVVEGDVGMGLALTGHFLEAWVFHPRDKPLPPARDWMVERLQRSGLL